ncbi:hypothetical protein [Actinoplanes solisilvae]|uniref:hypothetical protein n=1 Tax=Actinoplanes solisilvae TaxID=2486853 RepID=UPI000FD95B1A|nr:hypothetical protein [Actinoplanes solisilvae]
MLDVISAGVVFVGLILMMTSIAMMVRWWWEGRGRSTRRPDSPPWVPLAFLSIGMIQLAGVIVGVSPWWRPAIWLLLAAATGARMLSQRRAATPGRDTPRSQEGTSTGPASGE